MDNSKSLIFKYIQVVVHMFTNYKRLIYCDNRLDYSPLTMCWRTHMTCVYLIFTSWFPPFSKLLYMFFKTQILEDMLFKISLFLTQKSGLVILVPSKDDQ